ncbi:MAG TPA: dTDP-4-amino-4,6-dideoxygalactose transaminase [Flavobacteriales bacterium]|nr:dTDP-4-amino-4,6-dideoxygalactose transaminase [Flavobacteriales bacterium]
MIVFNQALITGNELKYLEEVIASKKLGSDGIFTQKCSAWLEDNVSCKKALLTPSCTHALELAALLLNIQPGDEIISTSFGFVSSANAFVLRGATMVFVDIRTDTLNMDESKIEAAITEKTKAIVPVHYAGVGCDMDVIMEIASKHNLKVVEDAAQGIMSKYDSRPLGSIGHLGTFSFHDTKNYTCGEGGALLINDEDLIERAEILREKGTNRKKFLRGEIDKYSWVDIGSSYLLSELNSAFLWAQLEESEKIKAYYD